jgi:hypothetical protein
MPQDKANAVGETLLRQMRRLLARVGAARGGDRKQLLALLDDVEAARRGLLRECEEIEKEMRRATVRTTAIGAYLRGSQAGHGRRQN